MMRSTALPGSGGRAANARARAGAIVALALAAAGCGHGEDASLAGVDLTVDRDAIIRTLAIEERIFEADDCSIAEGSVPAPGVRRLLTFDTIIVNRGTADLVIGDPAHPELPFRSDDFEFSVCHGHFHFRGFADYELHDGHGRVGVGHKQSFCVADFRPYGDRPSSGYTCEFQGISVDWADRYGSDVEGQWVDVTDVPAGEYTLIVTVNPEGRLPETADREPNTVTVPVQLPPR